MCGAGETLNACRAHFTGQGPTCVPAHRPSPTWSSLTHPVAVIARSGSDAAIRIPFGCLNERGRGKRIPTSGFALLGMTRFSVRRRVEGFGGACAAGQFLTPHFSFLIIMYYYTPKPPFPQSFSAICGKTA